MVTLDSVLGVAIPVIAVIAGVYLMYKPLAEPLGGLFRGIASFFRWIKRMITGEDEYDRLYPHGFKTLSWEE